MLTVLKLGGSAITAKDTPETVDTETLDRAVTAIADTREHDSTRRLVVVHGGGSFGHHHAAQQNVSTDEGTHDATAVTTIHRAMGRLNGTVLDRLHREGLAALPVRPLSAVCRRPELSFPVDQIETMLQEGFLPVVHGDVIAQRQKGATILSGDEIVVSLAETLGADRVGLCSTVPGVLDQNGEVIERIERYEEVATALGESDETDVTGGMAGKVHRLLELDTPACIFDVRQLEGFLRSGSAGTVVV